MSGSKNSGRPKYTPQQDKAIHTRNVSIALSAGAGCGKTFVLTQRFLAGLEPGADETELRTMVAITFTERAAREMRDRIRTACQQRLQTSPVDEVQFWLGVLRGLDAARISTIHAFCTGLLRSQAVDAGLDPRFAVLEPDLADTLLRQAAKETLHGQLEAGDADAEELVLEFGLERTRDHLRSLASQRFQVRFEDFDHQDPAAVASQWRRRWEHEFVPRLIAEFRTSTAATRLLELLRENIPGHPTMAQRRVILLEILQPEREWPAPEQILPIIIEHARVSGGGRADTWPDPEAYPVIKDTLTSVRDLAKELVEELTVNDDDLLIAAEFSVRALRLAHRTAEAYEALKRAQGALDFDDLLLQARELLRTRDDVRDRVADGIRLLMVDEFQDTDPVQAEVVRMLCGEALTRGRLFLVGDAKQSIYRFRRADPGVFARLRREIPAEGQLPLSVNFRSQPAVLNFVNHLFTAGMGDHYEALDPFDQQQYTPGSTIEFLFATSDAPDPDSPRPQATELLDRPSTALLRAREADWIARRCAELLADPTQRIRAKNAQGVMQLRRVIPGDIVILFRSLTNVHDYETALRRYGVDYYLVGGKAFFAQQEVFDLLNLCRYLDDADDLVALVGILRSPFFNLSDDAIQAIAWTVPESRRSNPGTRTGERLTLHDTLQLPPPKDVSAEQQRRIAFARETLAELRRVKDRIPLVQLLTLAVERTGYDAALLTEHLGSRKVANLRKLIAMAAEFDHAERFTLKDFVERLQTSVLEESDEEFATTLPETGDVVRLMSIHQSKGLEFPVVFVADINRKGPPRGKPAVLHPDFGALIRMPESFGQTRDNLGLRMYARLEEDADAEETIRLFYVACTRAADYLILSAGLDPLVPAHSPKNSPWFRLLQSRFDIETGQLRTDPLLGSSAAGTANPDTIPDVRVHHEAPFARRPKREIDTQIPLNQFADLVRSADPTEIPRFARVVPRDAADIPPLSVSRLESLDADLHGISHVRGPRSDVEVLDADQATALGSLVHVVLERINFADPSHWPELLETARQTLGEPLSDITLDNARQMLARLIVSPLMDELSTAKHLQREVEFTLRWPGKTPNDREVLIRGIIDLLYEDSEGNWHILDYKTNDFPSHATDDQLLSPYELQLGVYAYAVSEWMGIVPRELSLIALRPTVRRIVLPWSAARWDQLATRIDASLAQLRRPS